VEIVTPFPFIPDIKPDTVGPIFEIRRYSLTPGSLPGVMKRWEGSIGARAKLSPVVLAGGVEFGGANRFIHIWAYKSMDQRLAVREQARKRLRPGRRRRAAGADHQDRHALPFSPLQ
jgi:hypothetical protein